VPCDPDIHQRRSIRLATWNYHDSGAYFVTICTHNRLELFGRCAGGELVLSCFGKIVEDAWRAIPEHCPTAATDEFIVMPNHVHGILSIAGTPAVGACHDAPLRPDTPSRSVLSSGSLGAIVLQFKSAAAKRINELRGTLGAPVWQCNYHERILRERELNPARQYIRDNPRKWAEDKHNPALFAKH